VEVYPNSTSTEHSGTVTITPTPKPERKGYQITPSPLALDSRLGFHLPRCNINFNSQFHIDKNCILYEPLTETFAVPPGSIGIAWIKRVQPRFKRGSAKLGTSHPRA
jgi:hypothetical protein